MGVAAVRFAAVLGVAILAACGSSPESEKSNDSPRIVVSTGIVGAIVRGLVGAQQPIVAIVPNGKDPHEFSPSARDIESMANADIVVVNGNGLEAGMGDALASLDPARVFALADHVKLRGADPHLWLDPATVRQAVPSLAGALGTAIGRDLSVQERNFTTDLEALDARIARTIAAVDDCKLVTDHEALAYFAARYGCTIVGSVVPGLSTAGESTAGDLAKLKSAIAGAGVRAIFTEPNESGDVARSVGNELGVNVVELNVEQLPDSGAYGDLMTQLADAVVRGLATK